MPRSQHKNSDNEQPQEYVPQNKSTVRSPEKSNLAEAQNEDFKIAIMNMFKDLKKGRNTCLNKVYEDTVKHNSENN